VPARRCSHGRRTPCGALAGERRYLPVNVPLVKQVAAAEGDRACAIGEALFVNGRFLALRRRLDGAGRPLPWWSGCIDLGHGDLLLLTRVLPTPSMAAISESRGGPT
jgi:type IV secretory pathway protease TraF